MLDLQERGRALEWAFYQVLDRARFDELANHYAQMTAERALRAAAGVDDAALLEELQRAQVTPTAMTALVLLPLLQVAWADGAIQDGERDALVRAAEQHGFAAGSAGRELLEAWLRRRPGDDVLAAWAGYIAALVEHLAAADRKRLMATVVGRCRDIARAAGGLLGLATISSAEQDLLDRVEDAFKFPEQFATVFARA